MKSKKFPAENKVWLKIKLFIRIVVSNWEFPFLKHELNEISMTSYLNLLSI